MPELTLDLNQSLDDNLNMNKITPKGGKLRKIRGGDDTNPAPAPAPEADQKKVVTVSLLKGAYDFLLDKGVKVGTIVSEVAVAGALVYVANQFFGPDVCTPLYGSVSKTLATYVPIAAGPSQKCDAAATAYHNAIGSAILVAGPILIDAFKRAGKLVLSEAQVEEIGGEIIETIQNPAASAISSISSMKRRGSTIAPPSKALPPSLQASKNPFAKGGKRTKKRNMKKLKKTRRPARFFKY